MTITLSIYHYPQYPQGTTRLLMTRIPHFREVILTSFDCSHCGHHNTGFQPGRVQELGVRYELAIKEARDLSRQVVKSDHATFSIPEVELEIPGDGEKGGELGSRMWMVVRWKVGENVGVEGEPGKR